jgi:hypothetical protein
MQYGIPTFTGFAYGVGDIGGGADVTLPTLVGSITVSAITSTSYTLAWPAGADNIGVVAYEYSLNGGTSYTTLGNVLTVNVTGRTPSATDQIKVRVKDAAGNISTPALSTSVTLQAASLLPNPIFLSVSLTGQLVILG